MGKFSAIEALTFDVFGTVVDWRSSIAAEAAQLLGDRHGIEADWFAFANDWRAKYQPAMENVRRGDRGFVKLDVLHRENLVSLLADRHWSDIPAATVDELNLAWHRLKPWPDSVAGMTEMRRSHILASLSNGNISLIVEMAKHSGIPWDVILGAEVARAFKPQPQAYLAAAEALSLDPGQCMMVAAHNGDLVAAASHGFKTAFVRRAGEYGPQQTADLEAENAYDIIAEDMIDLAGQLAAGS